MSVDSVEELRSSLKQLFHSSDFSDLTITSREAQYRVHKAVVCPRSKYFASQCRDIMPEDASDGCLNLSDDDPKAVGMVIRYFYYLDYPSEPTDAPQMNGHTHMNGAANGHAMEDEDLNGSVKSDDRSLEKDVSAEDPGETLDDFLPPQPQRLSKKQKKRAKAQAKEAGSIASPDSHGDSVSSPTAHETPQSQAREHPIEGSGAFLGTKTASSASAHDDDSDATKRKAPNEVGKGNLVLHANVYALSRKYGIAGLQSMALDKFQAEAEGQWNTEQFLHAAKEVYDSCSDEGHDRRMKEVVVGIISRRGELMDQVEAQEVMRTLPKELMFDILMQVRQQGGFIIDKE